MILYDSDNPDSIPDGVWAAGYCDGYAAPAWNLRGWSRFPSAKRIAVFGQTNDGDVLDVERGDATPSEAPQWVRWRIGAGVKLPWVYCNRSNRALVERELSLAGIRSSQVALWVATLDGTQTVPAGLYPVAAVQYANTLHSGGHYDLSIVNALYGPGQGAIGGDDLEAVIYRNPVDGSEWQVDWFNFVKRPVSAASAAQLDKVAKDLGLPGVTVKDNANVGLDQIPLYVAPTTGTPDDDSAFVSKAALKSAIGGL